MTTAPSTTPSPLLERARHLRGLLATNGPLAKVPIGAVPILWNNVDIAELRLGTAHETILDEIARTGYDGVQLGIGFPEGDELRRTLAERDLRLAEVYASIASTVDGPTAGALSDVRDRMRLLIEGGGEVLCIAFDSSPDRDRFAGRVADPATPSLTEAGWAGTVELLEAVAAEAVAAGVRIAFHPHAGTYVETPDEVDRLTASLPPDVLPLCLDVGHWTVGGGDPLDALRRFGERVTHVHLKDVDPTVLDSLRAGTIPGFLAAIRARLFTELGSGVLDLDGVLDVLAERGYDGWLMVEQDSGWPPPAESAAIGRRVLAASLRRQAAAARAAQAAR